LKQTGRGSSGHILEQEEHAVEQLHLVLIEKCHVQGTVFEADVDDLVLPFLEVLDPLDLIDVDPEQTLLEGEVGKQLQNFSQHDIPAIKHGLVELIPHLAI